MSITSTIDELNSGIYPLLLVLIADESRQQHEGRQNRSHHPPNVQNVHRMSRDPHSKSHEPQVYRKINVTLLN